MNIKLIIAGIFIMFSQKSFCQNWEAFSTDASEAVRGFYVDTINDLLYIGGPFRFVNGQEMRGITAWDGDTFHSLSSSADNCGNFNCNSIIPAKFYNGELYCSTGGVTSINGVNMNGICRWDGQNWNTVGNGLTYDESGGIGGQMLVYNDELYVTGGFNKAGTVDAIGLAKWDGVQWYSLDNQQSIDSISFLQTWSIALFEDEIYIGGNMSVEIDGIINSDLIKYDGTRFHPVANGTLKGELGGVNAIEVYKDELYIGGLISNSEGNPGNGIMKLEGDEWVDVGGSFDANLYKVQDMFVYDDKLYVVGIFNSVGGGIPANNIATWDGEQWCSLGSTIDGIVNAGVIYNDQVYIGGGFDSIDDENIESLARWIGGQQIDTCGATVSTTSETITEQKNHINIYPNPTSGFINIEVYNNIPSSNFDLQIFNILGQEVYKEAQIQLNQGINISSFPNGIYWLNLSNNKSNISIIEPLIVQK